MSIVYNSSLQSYNTFGVDSVCRAFASFVDVPTLQTLLYQADAPVFILGGGSNVLLPDHFDRWVLRNEIGGIAITHTDGNALTVRAGGGVIWHDLVTWAVDQGLGGLENLALIPGTVGASPIQNIGAYGVELVDCFQQLTAYHRERGEVRTFDAQECSFGYRDSIFKQNEKDQWVILHVDFCLQREPVLQLEYGVIQNVLSDAGIDTPGVRDVYNAVIQIRQSKLPDPAQIGNAGSFFKNPVITTEAFQLLRTQFPDIPGYPVDDARTKIPAGWLIDRAGWKGIRRGPCGVHDRQALVLVNHGGATATQICALAEEVMADIQKQYGIDLEREVNILE